MLKLNYCEIFELTTYFIRCICPLQFLIRYLDFGNAEPRPQSLLAPLHSSCAELPPLAIKCSLASKSHTTFTQPVLLYVYGVREPYPIIDHSSKHTTVIGLRIPKI